MIPHTARSGPKTTRTGCRGCTRRHDNVAYLPRRPRDFGEINRLIADSTGPDRVIYRPLDGSYTAWCCDCRQPVDGGRTAAAWHSISCGHTVRGDLSMPEIWGSRDDVQAALDALDGGGTR